MFGDHRNRPCYFCELCYKGTILQKNYRKMTILCLGTIGIDRVIFVNCVIKGQFYKRIIGK